MQKSVWNRYETFSKIPAGESWLKYKKPTEESTLKCKILAWETGRRFYRGRAALNGRASTVVKDNIKLISGGKRQ